MVRKNSSKKMKGGQGQVQVSNESNGSMASQAVSLLGNKYVQIIVALIAIYITYMISLVLTDREGLIQPLTARKQKIVIFKGTHNLSEHNNKSYYTSHFDDDKQNYANVIRSQNFNPGAQFTYSMWMKINTTFMNDQNTPENNQDKVLLVKGIPKSYSSSNSNNIDYEVAAPMIYFKNRETMIISYNTTKSSSDNEPKYKQQLSVNNLSDIYGKWFMLTVVFSENVNERNTHPNGLVVKAYINDKEVTSKIHDGDSIKQNSGMFHFQPNGTIGGGYVADLFYYDYALSPLEIVEKMNKGFDTSIDGPVSGFDLPPYYNRQKTQTLSRD